jgi:CelD/BcsL family acetyltransferase involved in cellulose biosynthesis
VKGGDVTTTEDMLGEHAARRRSDPRTPALTAQTLRGRAAFLALLPEWRQLEARATRVPTPVGLLEQIVARIDVSAPRVVTIRAGDELVGIWALRRQHAGPLSIASRLGRTLQPYDDLVLAPGCDAEAVAQAAWAEVRRWRDVDAIQLPSIEQRSILRSVPDIAAAARPSDMGCVLDLTLHADPSSYLAGRSKNRRKAARRSLNQLKRRGPVVFADVEDPHLRRKLVTEAIALKCAWLDERNAPSPALRAPWFIEVLAAAAAEPGAADPGAADPLKVFHLTAGGQTAAIEIGMVDGDVYRSYLGTYSPDFAHEHPGATLTLNVIGWSIEAGLTCYDMLPPETPFKKHWTDTEVMVHGSVVPLSWRGELTLPLLRNGRQWAKQLYGRLPERAQEAAIKVIRRGSR